MLRGKKKRNWLLKLRKRLMKRPPRRRLKLKLLRLRSKLR